MRDTRKPQRRQCRLCGRNDVPEAMVFRGHTESKPGWCGGPRQGGRPVYMHQACIDAYEEREAAAAQRRAEGLAAAKAYVAECQATGAEVDLERWDQLMEGLNG